MALLGFFAISKNVFPIGFVPGKSVGDLNTIIPQLFHQLFPAWSAGIAYATLGRGRADPGRDHVDLGGERVHPGHLLDVHPAPGLGQGGAPGQPVGVAVHEVRRGRGRPAALPPQYSTDFQSIGGMIVLQTMPAVFFGLLTGWFHRGALIAGMLVGLGLRPCTCCTTPRSTRPT